MNFTTYLDHLSMVLAGAALASTSNYMTGLSPSGYEIGFYTTLAAVCLVWAAVREVRENG